jgi:hypothetical protein
MFPLHDAAVDASYVICGNRLQYHFHLTKGRETWLSKICLSYRILTLEGTFSRLYGACTDTNVPKFSRKSPAFTDPPGGGQMYLVIMTLIKFVESATVNHRFKLHETGCIL